MPETPLPQPLPDGSDPDPRPEASRPRRRVVTGDPAAQARAEVSNGTAHATALEAEAADKTCPQAKLTELTQSDLDFVSALHDSRVALELAGGELVRAAQYIRSSRGPARRLDLLEAYYAADGDPELSQQRQAKDRWFLFSVDDRLTATTLVRRLMSVTPELVMARLERVGDTDGALLLRAGDHLCGIEDDRVEEHGALTVRVRDIVRAFNVLLDRHMVRARLVGLFGDGKREAYIGQDSLVSAIMLANAQYLDAPDAKGLLQRTAW